MSDKEDKRRLDEDQFSKAELLHNLQVHQIELEMQNRQLRESQQELEEARDRYADLYDFAPVGYLTLNEFGVVQEINLTGAGMLGMERFNITGQPFLLHLTASSIQPFLTHLRQTFSVAENDVTEVFIKTRNGHPRVVSLESQAMPGEKCVCRTVMHDITMQRRMSVALQMSRSAQDALLKAIPALVFYLDDGLCFQNVSQVFADFVGKKPEEVIGKKIHDLFPVHIADDMQEVCTLVMQSGKAIYGYENTMTDLNGTVCYMSTMVAPFLDYQGKIIGLVGASIDITGIKSASISNSELLLQNRKLTRNLYTVQEEERRHLAHELHDELGQWFTAIQAEAQIVCNISGHDSRIHESALAIGNNVRNVHGVIRGMLRKLRPSMLDELGLADSLRDLVLQWCHSHPDIVCVLEIEPTLNRLGEELNITIYRLVQEALNNISSHAHAHRVTVNLTKAQADYADSGIIVLNIEDDGVGFVKENIRPGIGLLGMRERAISAGGEFSIMSSPGKGTKIFVWLPIGKPRV